MLGKKSTWSRDGKVNIENLYATNKLIVVFYGPAAQKEERRISGRFYQEGRNFLPNNTNILDIHWHKGGKGEEFTPLWEIFGTLSLKNV